MTTAELADQAKGRIFQNPYDKKEIWINVGSYVGNHLNDDLHPLVFPDYDNIIGLYVSKQAYNDLILFLKTNLEPVPCVNEGYACIICCCTLGLCFCPLIYVNRRYKSLKKNMIDNFKNQSIIKELEISLVFIGEKTLPYNSNPWIDSTGQTLMLEEVNKSSEAGGKYPPGVNMVLKLPAEIPWPSPLPPIPINATYLSSPDYHTTTLGDPPPYPNASYLPSPEYQPPPLGDAPPYVGYHLSPLSDAAPYPIPTDNEPQPYTLPPPQGTISQQPATVGHSYCGECGNRIMGTKFCTSCGASI